MENNYKESVRKALALNAQGFLLGLEYATMPAGKIMKRKLAPEARYHPEPKRRKMPLAEVNRQIHGLSHGMVLESTFPPNPNWIVDLQELLERANIDLNLFVDTSYKSGLWPIFSLRNGRLRVAATRVGAATPELMFELIKKVYS